MVDGGTILSFHITAGKLESWSEALFQTGSGKAHPSRPAVADTDFVLLVRQLGVVIRAARTGTSS